jgi:hypothetical protein
MTNACIVFVNLSTLYGRHPEFLTGFSDALLGLMYRMLVRTYKRCHGHSKQSLVKNQQLFALDAMTGLAIMHQYDTVRFVLPVTFIHTKTLLIELYENRDRLMGEHWGDNPLCYCPAVRYVSHKHDAFFQDMRSNIKLIQFLLQV